jgi:hypothetical protein
MGTAGTDPGGIRTRSPSRCRHMCILEAESELGRHDPRRTALAAAASVTPGERFQCDVCLRFQCDVSGALTLSM